MVNNSKSFVLLYHDSKNAENMFEVCELIYSNAKLLNFKYEYKDDNGFIHKYFVLIMQLGFNIKYSTLKDRFGNAILKANIIHYVNCLPENILEDTDATEDKATKYLNITFRNEIAGVNIEKEIERESLRSTYNNTNETHHHKSKLKSWN